VTTLPAKAGSFWPEPEASAPAGASRTTLDATAYVTVRRPSPGPRSGPCRPEGAAPLLVLLPWRAEVLNAICTGEHLTEPKLPRTRDTSYPAAFPLEPPQRIVYVKVPSLGTTKPWVGQATRAYRRTLLRDPHSPPA